MTLLKFSSLLISILLLVNCSSSVETSVSNKNGPTKILTLDDYNLTFTIPSGWTRIDDNYKKVFEAWLVSDNKKSAIGIIPVHISKNELLGSDTDKLNLVRSVILNKKKSNADVELISDETKNFARDAIELRMLVDDNFQNSIIFGENESYFECLAYFLEGYKPTDDEIEQLLNDQAQFVTECKIK